MSKFQLVMQMGPSPGKTISLGETEHYLGRDENNTIVVNDAELSRRHCHFIFTDGGFEIEDMGSTNGTFVNEKRTSGRYRLNLGDIIRLGDNVALVFELFGSDPNATVLARNETPPRGQAVKPPPQVAATPTPAPAAQPAPVPKPAGKVRPERRSGKRPSPMVIGCGVLVLIGLCILIGGWYYVDTYAPEYYCYFLPFLPGCP
ncbi:MAG: FHA domain-containing protein [Chloroflexi bacterium]|jgi:pSer/pThr/pTyr-binding forkhead associated (FHA) protein|nr:FHA domain-containing protein [Chloroflexota bacterium]MBT3671196.1 FHA domain-containing protein [Chloroflexota bacterium]MBT4002522.1 FHA domain-containing protein [Chloroflexota bacterium]MBT4304345.1 FHA domain-containing protein [Chloroflexota bacterium]MBT4534364.1 FHA domain-containing protein [Chloroflexota bacterium]